MWGIGAHHLRMVGQGPPYVEREANIKKKPADAAGFVRCRPPG
jgi:hypothetical protein